jgi:hypothetical protein
MWPGTISQMEANMLRTRTLAAIILVLLVGFGFKIIVAPPRTVAATEPNPVTLAVYDLHVGHPNMKNLPVQEAPLP